MGSHIFVMGRFFNISHSNKYSVCAVSEVMPIGIDIELNRNVPFMKEIAKRFFHIGEQRVLEKDGWSTERFFKIWVSKEAVVKCLGEDLFKVFRCFNSYLFPVEYKKILIQEHYIHFGIFQCKSKCLVNFC